MIQVTTSPRDNIVTAVAHGTVTGADYDKNLIPVIEEKLQSHGKIRLLYQLGQDFSGYTLTALWDDAKLGVEHLRGFEKIAIVTDVNWISEASRVFGLFIPCPVTIFRNDQLSEAKDWLNRDILFLLKPNFMDQGKEPHFCSGCAQMLGILEYYPELKQHLDIEYVEFSRPRPALVELLGVENQSCPVLVLKKKPEDLASDPQVLSANGHLFVEGANEIANYLAHVYRIGIPY